MTRRTFTGSIIAASLAAAERKTRNVIFVMTDGLRWQEVFGGADAKLLNKESGGVADVEGLTRTFWRETAKERREALMPFLWNVIGKTGQIYGNRETGSEAYVTNNMNFSYPGYNETLTGFADPKINSNSKIPNANTTVFEWLHRKPAYRGKVAAFGSWDVFPFIFNAERAGFPVNAAHDALKLPLSTPRLDLLNRLRAETRVWNAMSLDALLFHSAMEYLKERKPRVLFISLGETDEWSHEGKYAEYLHAAHRVDRYLKDLWDTIQSMPEYKGTTSLIFAPDHGRGEAPVEWKSHGQKVPDSKYIWMAFMGPDTRGLGERSQTAAVTQRQIAATLAALLGEDYAAAEARAGKPIADVLSQ